MEAVKRRKHNVYKRINNDDKEETMDISETTYNWKLKSVYKRIKRVMHMLKEEKPKKNNKKRKVNNRLRIMRL